MKWNHSWLFNLIYIYIYIPQGNKTRYMSSKMTFYWAHLLHAFPFLGTISLLQHVEWLKSSSSVIKITSKKILPQLWSLIRITEPWRLVSTPTCSWWQSKMPVWPQHQELLWMMVSNSHPQSHDHHCLHQSEILTQPTRLNYVIHPFCPLIW